MHAISPPTEAPTMSHRAEFVAELAVVGAEVEVGVRLGVEVDGLPVGLRLVVNGVRLGVEVGIGLGVEVGIGLGVEVGIGLGVEVGIGLGAEVGIGLGVEVGIGLGVEVGIGLGAEVGIGLGAEVGIGLGVEVGVRLGVEVGARLGVLVLGATQYLCMILRLRVIAQRVNCWADYYLIEELEPRVAHVASAVQSVLSSSVLI
jgi:hypothetical protein